MRMRGVRIFVIGCVALLLGGLPLTVNAQERMQRLPAPAPGVIYFDFSEGFAAVQVGQKYGYINRTGAFVIPAQFDGVGGFRSGLSGVKVGGKWGYIDTAGKQVIAPQFDDAGSFTDVGLARVKVGGKWGFIDRTGSFAIPAQFEDASGFGEETPVTFPERPAASPVLAPVKVDGKWGYIDTAGKLVIAPQFDDANGFAGNGLAAVNVGGTRNDADSKVGFINKTGVFVIPPQFYDANIDEPERFIGMQVGDLFGIADAQTGAVVVSPRFEFVGDFIGGVAAAKIGGKYGFIYPNGEIAIAPQFAHAEDFDPQGMAVVQADANYGIITKIGATPTAKPTGGQFGVIDRTGRFVIPPRFEALGDFTDGLAEAQVNGKVGFIDRSGAFVIAPTFVPDPNRAPQ